MKLLIAIVQDQDAPGLIDVVTESDFRVTRLATSGGFLKAGNTTLLMGVDEERIEELLEIIKENCEAREVPTSFVSMSIPGDTYMPYPINVTLGGATIFILDVEEYLQY